MNELPKTVAVDVQTPGTLAHRLYAAPVVETLEGMPRVGGSSPWGRIQYLTVHGHGIVSVGTASHGGFWISKDREASLPDDVKAPARQYAPAQWYEEDCDWCIPAIAFFADLTPESKDRIRPYLGHYLTREGGRYDALAAFISPAERFALIDAFTPRT